MFNDLFYMVVTFIIFLFQTTGEPVTIFAFDLKSASETQVSWVYTY